MMKKIIAFGMIVVMCLFIGCTSVAPPADVKDDSPIEQNPYEEEGGGEGDPGGGCGC